MSSYSHKLWKEFSKSVMELDGYRCVHCSKTSAEAVLQVHHKRYIDGRKPWEYGLRDCETVCKGCHASIHGKVRPKFGWEYCGDEDLEDLIGECQYCGSQIRYVFTIHHKDWGTLEVGTMCCDNLTDSKVASNLMESNTKYVSRRRRFLNSARWTMENGIHRVRQCGFAIAISEREPYVFLSIHGLESIKPYLSVSDAKAKAFDVIESGDLASYLKSHDIPMESATQSKRSRKQLKPATGSN